MGTYQTKAMTFVGTVRYMSPERLTGQPYSDASDLWALGTRGTARLSTPTPSTTTTTLLCLQTVVLLCRSAGVAVAAAVAVAVAAAAAAAYFLRRRLPLLLRCPPPL